MRVITKKLILAGVILMGFVFILKASPISAAGNYIGCCQMNGNFCFNLENKDNTAFCTDLPEASLQMGSICEKGQCTASSTKSITVPDAIELSLNQPLPGMDPIMKVDGGSITRYLSVLYQFAIGVVGLIALLMLTIGGLQWLFAGGNASRISGAKETILGALTGLVLVLSAYTILNFINPKLVSPRTLTIPMIPLKELEVVSNQDFTAITGRKPLPAFSQEIVTKLLATAKKINIHPCTFFSIVGAESGGRENVIGHDEDVSKLNNSGGSDIPARRAFVNQYQCVMQSGNTSKATCALGEKALINDDPIKFSKSLNVNDPDLGLDWRFSHGIGLTQTTIFPNKLCKNTSGKHCYPAGGREFTARELLSADNALEATGLQWKSYYCSNLYEPTLDCFRKYVGVGTQWTETTSAIKMNLYNQCKTQHPDWK